MAYERFARLMRAQGEHAAAKYVARVAAKAESRGADGKLSLRAGARIFEEALTADSEVVAEYLSGVLASSRSADGADDDGV